MRSFKDRYINGFLLTSVAGQTLDSCKQMCIKDKDCQLEINNWIINYGFFIHFFNYSSADYNSANKHCYIRTETKDTKPAYYLLSTSYTHFENACEEEQRNFLINAFKFIFKHFIL